jgi:hypothetical protein
VFDVLSGAAAARGIVWKNLPFSVSEVAASRRVNGTAVKYGNATRMREKLEYAVSAIKRGAPVLPLVKEKGVSSLAHIDA